MAVSASVPVIPWAAAWSDVMAETAIGTLWRFSERRCAVTTMSRSEEHTSELQSLMRISYAVFCLKQKTKRTDNRQYSTLSIDDNHANTQAINHKSDTHNHSV